MGSNRLEHLFNPRSIAVFGARASGRSLGARVYSNIISGGFAGPVIPVNASQDKFDGKRCYATIGAYRGKIDLAVIGSAPSDVSAGLIDCAQAGIRHAIVMSAGLGDEGPQKAALDRDLRAVAGKTGIRFLGPNSIGLVRPGVGLNASYLTAKVPQGGLAMVSQSPALCAAVLDYAGPNHIGFSTLTSLGDTSEIGIAEVLDFLATDFATKAILLYVEDIPNARSFLSALRMAAQIKPVVVLRTALSPAVAGTARTRAGDVVKPDVVFDAALDRAGALRVDTFGRLFAAAEILSSKTRAGGDRLAIVTNGGGAGRLAAYRAKALNLTLTPPSNETVDRLDAVLPAHWSRQNPIDLLGIAQPQSYRTAVETCLEDPQFDGVLVLLTPQAKTRADATAKTVIDAASNSRKPVLACWMGDSSTRRARRRLTANGIPDFQTPERAVEAFSYLAQRERNRRLALETPQPLSAGDRPDIESARKTIELALDAGREILSDLEAKRVLQAFRIPVNMPRQAGSCAQAKKAAWELGFPVAIKIDAPEVTYKSDVDGVWLNIRNNSNLTAAWSEVTQTVRSRRPEVEIRGVTVEPMVWMPHSRQLMMGAARDARFGPVILFGAGGTVGGALQDTAVALPPLNDVLADRLIDRTRIARLLAAYRGNPPANREAVTSALLRLSDLVCEFPQVIEVDINPFLVGPDGAICLGARMRVGPPAQTGQHEHMAIRPYPRHLEQTCDLADGTTLLIRPVRPEDAESERQFFKDLSAEARRLRFMYALNELTPEMLVESTQIDYERQMALLAFTQENGLDVQQGGARYTIDPNGISCEFAIVVSERRRNQGIGRRLMLALLDTARAHGLSVMRGTVLAENEPMLKFMDALQFSCLPDEEDSALVIVERAL